jgi:class 3 adenylate cyclase
LSFHTFRRVVYATVGFTQFTDASDPEEVAKLLSEYLGEMANIVRHWGGTIPQFTGDSIFAIFGAPDTLGVHQDALACVRMATEMQTRMKELREKWWNEGVQFPFEIRCGIHTGMANVGNYGSEGFIILFKRTGCFRVCRGWKK